MAAIRDAQRRQQIGVVNGPPIYAAGLTSALGDSYRFVVIEHPDSWISDGEQALVMLTLTTAEEFGQITDLCRRAPHVSVIAVLAELTAEAVTTALRNGATGVVGLYSAPDDVRLALDAAQSEHAVIAIPLMRSMIGSATSAADRDILTENDVNCLDALAHGQTVAALAEDFGYSEREMYRRLNRMYSRMTVTGRTEALVLAARWGVID